MNVTDQIRLRLESQTITVTAARRPEPYVELMVMTGCVSVRTVLSPRDARAFAAAIVQQAEIAERAQATMQVCG